MLRVPFACCLLSVLLSAQNTVVSPTRAATIGGGGNSYPWGQPVMHYMQVHSDIKGTVRIVNQLSFRQPPGNGTFSGTRAIDVEMLMGNTVGYDEVQPTYAANYLGSPTMVVARKVINMGPQGAQATPTSPFNGMAVPLDVVFPYIGVDSLGWEARVYSNILSGSFNSSDAFSSSAVPGTNTVVGTGCTASGQTTPMSLATTTYQTIHHLTVLNTLTNAPSNAATVLAIGATNPSLNFPGMCGPLYTDLALMLPVGSTDAMGTIASGGSASLLFKRNPAPGATFYAQMHSIDAGSTMPIPVANSNGMSWLLPTLVPVTITEVTRLYLNGNATGPRASLDSFGVYGYAIATQFHY